MSRPTEPSEPLPVGLLVEGVVVKHWPYGIEMELENGALGTVEIIYLDDDSTKWGPAGYPPIGERRKAVVQGTTPRGQLRLTMRQEHVRNAEAKVSETD